MELNVNILDPARAELGDGVVAVDPRMTRVLETARVIARYRTAVLVTGETGSGKEVIARLIHSCSERSSRPWIDVNCATLPEHLVESELFGYEKGAFSGADSAKPGLFELANGGTLFLDEIGEIDPRVQVKLLRVLDSIPFYRLGGCRKVAVDVRLIAATNRNLEAAVHNGTFRRDLYHRITEFHVAIPPLRERPLDVAALAAHFLARCRPDVSLSEDALALLSTCEWPGNVRELRSVVHAAGMFARGPLITAADVAQHLTPAASGLHQAAEQNLPSVATVNEMERRMIVRALEETGGNQSLAALRLGIPRRTFCRKLNTYNITLGRRKSEHVQSPVRSSGNCRAELHIPVTVQTLDGRRTVAQSCDLSAGGIGLYGVSPLLAIGEEVDVSFFLPDHSMPIDVRAQTAWSRPDGSTGLKFIHLTPAAADVIRLWIDGCGEVSPTPTVAGCPAPAQSRDQALRL
jgi:DNA-binding NtrC family response regulator